MPTAEDYLVPAVLVDSETPLSKVVGLLRNQKKAAHALVTEGGKYVGVIDDRALRRFQGNMEITKAWKLAKTARKLTRNAQAEEIVEAFLNTESKVLPVLQGEKPVGAVPRAAALQILLESPAINGKRVEQLMTRPPLTIAEESTIAEAEHIMRGSGVYRLVVVDERGRLAGVVSSYDLATKVKPTAKASRRESTFRPEKEQNVQEEPVKSVMSTPVVTVAPEATVKEALKAMLQRGLSNLVVTRGDKPVGVFTVRDALETVATIPRQNIFLSGLREDEKVLQQGIMDEVNAFLERLRKSARVDYVTLHLRSTNEGLKRRYNVRARVSIEGHLHTSSTPDIDPHRKMWDAGMAVREALDEVSKQFYKHEKRKPVHERFDRSRFTEEG